MRPKHEPKPDVEYHYHIEELISRQEKRTDDRNYHRDRAKLAQERMDLIKDGQARILTDFWCDKCQIDLKGEAIKQVEVDWSNPTQYIAFYRTKCYKGHFVTRLITDRHKDLFWFKSRGVARDRGRHYADTVQPHETGFNMLYGKR
jgi:hypothetical protein